MKRPTRVTHQPVKRKPVQRKPQVRGAITRERLLEVALDQFVRHGFHGTSMRQIAAAAGLAVGGIYNHFSSKEAVFAAVLDANHPYRVVEAALQDVNAPTLEAFVREVSARIWQAIDGRQGRLVPLMFIELIEFQGQHAQVLAESLFPKVLAALQHFDPAAENRRPLPSPVVLRTFISLMAGHLLIESVVSRSALFRGLDYDWLEGELDIFLHGVMAC